MAANEIYYKRKANHECTYCGLNRQTITSFQSARIA